MNPLRVQASIRDPFIVLRCQADAVAACNLLVAWDSELWVDFRGPVRVVWGLANVLQGS